MHKKSVHTAIALVLVGIAMGSASATVTSFTPSNDAMVLTNASGAGSSNANGSGPGMFAGADGNGSLKRSLVKFNVTSLNGVTATQVELDLVIGQIAGSGGMGPGCGMACTPATRTFNLYVIDPTHTWTEGLTGSTACSGGLCPSIGGTGQGWPYAICGSGGSGCGGDVTWEYYHYNNTLGAGSSWGNAPTNQDYGSASFGSPTFGDHVSVGSATFNNFLNNATEAFVGSAGQNPALLAAVNHWLATPSSNNGLEIRGPALEGIHTSFIGWWTKEGAIANSNSALNPVLKITH